MALQTHFQFLKPRHREIKYVAWSHTASEGVSWIQILTQPPPSVWPFCPMVVIKNTLREMCYRNCMAWWSLTKWTYPYELPPNWQNENLLGSPSYLVQSPASPYPENHYLALWWPRLASLSGLYCIQRMGVSTSVVMIPTCALRWT